MRSQPFRGEAVFDYFNALEKKEPLLSEQYRQAMAEVIPLFYNDKYRVEIIVWATTPAETAWRRAAKQAFQIGREVAQMGNLNSKQQLQLQTTAKLWFDKEAKRPVVSIVTRRVK